MRRAGFLHWRVLICCVLMMGSVQSEPGDDIQVIDSPAEVEFEAEEIDNLAPRLSSLHLAPELEPDKLVPKQASSLTRDAKVIEIWDPELRGVLKEAAELNAHASQNVSDASQGIIKATAEAVEEAEANLATAKELVVEANATVSVAARNAEAAAGAQEANQKDEDRLAALADQSANDTARVQGEFRQKLEMYINKTQAARKASDDAAARLLATQLEKQSAIAAAQSDLYAKEQTEELLSSNVYELRIKSIGEAAAMAADMVNQTRQTAVEAANQAGIDIANEAFKYERMKGQTSDEVLAAEEGAKKIAQAAANNAGATSGGLKGAASNEARSEVEKGKQEASDEVAGMQAEEEQAGAEAQTEADGLANQTAATSEAAKGEQEEVENEIQDIDGQADKDRKKEELDGQNEADTDIAAGQSEAEDLIISAKGDAEAVKNQTSAKVDAVTSSIQQAAQGAINHTMTDANAKMDAAQHSAQATIDGVLAEAKGVVDIGINEANQSVSDLTAKAAEESVELENSGAERALEVQGEAKSQASLISNAGQSSAEGLRATLSGEAADTAANITRTSEEAALGAKATLEKKKLDADLSLTETDGQVNAISLEGGRTAAEASGAITSEAKAEAANTTGGAAEAFQSEVVGAKAKVVAAAATNKELIAESAADGERKKEAAKKKLEGVKRDLEEATVKLKTSEDALNQAQSADREKEQRATEEAAEITQGAQTNATKLSQIGAQVASDLKAQGTGIVDQSGSELSNAQSVLKVAAKKQSAATTSLKAAQEEEESATKSVQVMVENADGVVAATKDAALASAQDIIAGAKLTSSEMEEVTLRNAAKAKDDIATLEGNALSTANDIESGATSAASEGLEAIQSEAQRAAKVAAGVKKDSEASTKAVISRAEEEVANVHKRGTSTVQQIETMTKKDIDAQLDAFAEEERTLREIAKAKQQSTATAESKAQAEADTLVKDALAKIGRVDADIAQEKQALTDAKEQHEERMTKLRKEIASEFEAQKAAVQKEHDDNQMAVQEARKQVMEHVSLKEMNDAQESLHVAQGHLHGAEVGANLTAKEAEVGADGTIEQSSEHVKADHDKAVADAKLMLETAQVEADAQIEAAQHTADHIDSDASDQIDQKRTEILAGGSAHVIEAHAKIQSLDEAASASSDKLIATAQKDNEALFEKAKAIHDESHEHVSQTLAAATESGRHIISEAEKVAVRTLQAAQQAAERHKSEARAQAIADAHTETASLLAKAQNTFATVDEAHAAAVEAAGTAQAKLASAEAALSKIEGGKPPEDESTGEEPTEADFAESTEKLA